MRRIIERVVTVVTTTTWKISWDAEPPQAQPRADSVSNEVLSEITPGIAGAPVVIDAKEVEPTAIEKKSQMRVTETSQESYPSRSKHERKLEP